MRALLPSEVQRRSFLKAVGKATALAVISQFFPIEAAVEAFADPGAADVASVKMGFIPITCATPLILAAQFSEGSAAQKAAAGEQLRLQSTHFPETECRGTAR
jgi:hypothetical protein